MSDATRITDEAERNHGPAVRAIASEFMARYKGTPTPDAFALDAAQAGLRAALPHLGGATPAIDREALIEAAAKAIHRWDKKPITWEDLYSDDRAQYRSEAEVVVDAVLALIGGATP